MMVVLTVNEEEESLANLKRPRRWHSVACNAIETGLIMLVIMIIIMMIMMYSPPGIGSSEVDNRQNGAVAL